MLDRLQIFISNFLVNEKYNIIYKIFFFFFLSFLSRLTLQDKKKHTNLNVCYGRCYEAHHVKFRSTFVAITLDATTSGGKLDNIGDLTDAAE